MAWLQDQHTAKYKSRINHGTLQLSSRTKSIYARQLTLEFVSRVNTSQITASGEALGGPSLDQEHDLSGFIDQDVLSVCQGTSITIGFKVHRAMLSSIS